MVDEFGFGNVSWTDVKKSGTQSLGPIITLDFVFRSSAISEGSPVYWKKIGSQTGNRYYYPWLCELSHFEGPKLPELVIDIGYTWQSSQSRLVSGLVADNVAT